MLFSLGPQTQESQYQCDGGYMFINLCLVLTLNLGTGRSASLNFVQKRAILGSRTTSTGKHAGCWQTTM